MAPPVLAYGVHCLPPILHMQFQIPMSSYSKGAQGLSVFLRERGIFTATSISPSLWPRQCGDRYAIRAGRNLPDKEFRYLRTVIVTAAVYRGFNSKLRLRLLLLLTFRHRAGVSPYTSSCDFAQTYVFSKQSPPPFLCGSPGLGRACLPHPEEHPFFRRYGVILPSSLARVLSSALDYSSHPPELVSGTVCVPYA